MDNIKEKLLNLIRWAFVKNALETKHWIDLGKQGERKPIIYDLVDNLVAKGVTIQEWIPVEERLPEEPDKYLCNVKSFAFPGRFYHAILQYDKHGFREGSIYTDDVAHWMPLPEPPKGE